MIFSVGVLMVIQLASALSRQMSYAAARSTLVVLANESLDSLQALPFDQLAPGVDADTVLVQGTAYARTRTVTAVTPLLARIDVALTPVGATGPSHAVTSYSSEVW